MDRSAIALTIGFAAESVRETAPTVHCVTPRAATSFVADVLQGVGARSVVTGTSAEALKAMESADAVMLDLGTLTFEWSDAVAPTAGALASAGIPWVLDVTSAGRLPVAADRANAVLKHHPAILRADADGVEGVRFDGAGAVVLGEADANVVRIGGEEIEVPHGADMLAQIPGVRSAASALMAACAAVTGPAEAALAGQAWLALASERAAQAEQISGPASFRTALIDALWTVRGDEVAEYLNLR